MTQPRLILASASPRRRELLAAAGFQFQVLTSDADESFNPGLAPIEVAPLLAGIKADAVASTLSGNCIVIGADTIVTLDGTIYGKPADQADACRMLSELSGRTHQVITGVCVITSESRHSFAEVTDVTFRQLSAETIGEYVATGEPLDKAGAYGIQGLGGALVDHINGDYSNVVGLPVDRLAALLEQLL